MSTALFRPLALPGGGSIPNRIAKAAMEENMAAPGQVPGPELIELYRAWGAGGAGLLITGNVMVHDAAMTGPAGVVLDEHTPLAPFTKWADAAHQGGTKIWMQINHPGRQVSANMPGVAWAPSAVRVNLGKNSKRFAQPVAMTAVQIDETIERFATTARRAQDAGFDGVEIHAAHGYLLSQFLSPLTNERTDEYGGSLENRARMLLNVVRAVKDATRSPFAVAVKLNSADFQRGGFDAHDAREVIAMLADIGIDLVELSGGSYESPAMSGRAADSRTVSREAYFLELAAQLAESATVPLMLTGGIVRPSVAQQVLDSGIAVVGMASALAVIPTLPSQWKGGAETAVELAPVSIADKAVASAAGMARIRHQLRRIGRGRATQPAVNPKLSLVRELARQRRARARYSRWLANRGSAVR